jgi:hypothetical protein
LSNLVSNSPFKPGVTLAQYAADLLRTRMVGENEGTVTLQTTGGYAVKTWMAYGSTNSDQHRRRRRRPPVATERRAGARAASPALDPARYVDEQARRAFIDSLERWPTLAKLMGLTR